MAAEEEVFARRRAQLWLAMQPSFLNPLGMDIASSAAAIDELFDEVLPVEGDPQQEGVPAASPAAVLVHKELWDTFLADDLIAPGAPSGSQFSSQFSDDALPLRASFCGTRRPEDPSPSLKPRPNPSLKPRPNPSQAWSKASATAWFMRRGCATH